ncbi:MAG: glycoside hydrolase family 30 beta sandwich domain-containing protein [Candidatus Brocadiia bacterium]
MSLTVLLVSVLLVVFAGWASGMPEEDEVVTVDCARRHQTVHGFGTCLISWKADVKALYAKDEFRERYIHDLGASMVRLPLIPEVLPDEVEDPADITYEEFDFGHQNMEPLLEFAAAVHADNPDRNKVIGSVWSPPAWMKTNDQTTEGGHLRGDRYEHYAHYLAEWARGVEAEYGFPFYGISIQNELYFREPYNSCVYTPEEFRDAVKAVGDRFEELGLETRVMGPEDMTKFPDRVMGYVDAVMEDSRAAPHLDIVCSHGYADGIVSAGSAEENSALWDRVKEYDRQLWMTETSGEEPSWPRGALNRLGGKLHNALVYGNISGWSYWQITDVASARVYALMNMAAPTKKYFVSKHFFRFIRPGAVRVEASPDGAPVSVSAFVHEEDGTLTVVLLNRRGESTLVGLEFTGGCEVREFATYRTSEGEDCARLAETPVVGGKADVSMPAWSIVTLHGKFRARP